MSLDTQNDIMLALAGLYPDGYDGFPAGADTPQNFADYEAMTLTEGTTRHTKQELEEGLSLYQSSKEAIAIRRLKRSALFTQWDALPTWIKGPYRATFAAAVELLDAGQDEEAVALIQYEDAKAGYTTEQKETFEMVRAEIVTAMENLG